MAKLTVKNSLLE